MEKEPKITPVIDLIWTIEEEDSDIVSPATITVGCGSGGCCVYLCTSCACTVSTY